MLLVLQKHRIQEIEFLEATTQIIRNLWWLDNLPLIGWCIDLYEWCLKYRRNPRKFETAWTWDICWERVHKVIRETLTEIFWPTTGNEISIEQPNNFRAQHNTTQISPGVKCKVQDLISSSWYFCSNYFLSPHLHLWNENAYAAPLWVKCIWHSSFTQKLTAKSFFQC